MLLQPSLLALWAPAPFSLLRAAALSTLAGSYSPLLVIPSSPTSWAGHRVFRIPASGSGFCAQQLSSAPNSRAFVQLQLLVALRHLLSPFVLPGGLTSLLTWNPVFSGPPRFYQLGSPLQTPGCTITRGMV